MHRVLILGAGKIGALVSGLLGESGGYRVYLGDVNANAAAAVVKAHGLDSVSSVGLDATDRKAVDRQLVE
ncbi:MAG: saccharopine dehydrogenase NADP-binding domain-containing protein, partial [Steroidobacterales bacterium]